MADADVRPHVCFLTSSAPLGPGDAYSPFVLGLARRMNERGNRVTILMPHVAGSATRETLQGVRMRRFRYLSSPDAETLGAGGGMLPGLRKRKLDLLKVPALLWGQHQALGALHERDPVRILHSHWLIPQGVVGGRFAASRRVSHVATAHGSDLLGLRFPGMAAALRYAVRRSDRVTVNSEAMARALRARTGIDAGRVVPIGAVPPEPGAVRGNLERRRSLPDHDRVLGYVGRVVREKGILDFIRVLVRLRDAGRDVVGLVVGGGSDADGARRLATELGVEKSIRFTGPVPPERVPGHMSVMDALLVPSHYEAQGLVAVEAMLLGVPVAAFRTGGLAEVVVEGETGRTVEPGDLEALTGAAEALLFDAVLRRRLGGTARKRAVDRFTLDASADAFDRLYRGLLRP